MVDSTARIENGSMATEMATGIATGLAFCALALVLANLVSIVIAGFRLSRTGRASTTLAARLASGSSTGPAVSIVVPVRGLEAYSQMTLSHAFRLDWPSYELIFCVQDAADPIIHEIRNTMAAHPEREARLLIGDDRISANPKLNNCAKGWHAARHDWVVLADSNVLMPPNYLQALMAGRRTNSGLVCSTPIGSRPDGFFAEVECAFLNTLQARWQYVGEALGLGFAQGKSMLWQKSFLDQAGGIQALAAEIAEDAASTKLVNRHGLKVHLVASPFEQPLGHRTLGEIWSRQARWARLRRVTFPLFFTPELLLGALPPFLLALTAALLSGVPLLPVAALLLVSIYVPELLLAAAKGWRLSAMLVPAMMVRDVMLPAIWCRSWLTGSFDWRGNTMTIGTQESELTNAPAA